VPYLNNVVYTPHAVRRMDERSIEEARVYEALQNGEIIEEYDTDEERRYLIMHRDESDSIYSTSGLKVLTVPSVIHVAAADQAIGRTVVITAYDPGRDQASGTTTTRHVSDPWKGPRQKRHPVPASPAQWGG
jgi:hypothetical protein